MVDADSLCAWEVRNKRNVVLCAINPGLYRSGFVDDRSFGAVTCPYCSATISPSTVLFGFSLAYPISEDTIFVVSYFVS